MMPPLKQYKARRRQLKAQIKEVRAHLKVLKMQLRDLREEQQHNAVNRLEVLIDERPSFLETLKRLFWR